MARRDAREFADGVPAPEDGIARLRLSAHARK
jgi:hypothetical protein